MASGALDLTWLPPPSSRSSEPAKPAARGAPRCTQRLTSYAGLSETAELCFPADVAELRRVLRQAHAAGRRVTFRAGGNSFDGQALGSDLVISLVRLADIAMDVEHAEVTVGAGALWGDILAETARHGLVPHVMVTTRYATAGGTLSSHSLSRFTPTVGREGGHVRRLRLVLVDGTELECSATENSDVFRAVVGGFGYVGAIVEITHALLRAPGGAAGSDLAVETELRRATGVEELVDHLLAPVAQAATQGPLAAYAALFLRGARHSLVGISRYVAKKPARRCAFHSPGTLLHWLAQIAAHTKGLRELGSRLVLRAFRKPRRFVDDLFGFTFFEDGNRALRRLGRALGLPMGFRQQTFVIPCEAHDRTGAVRTLSHFLDCAQALLCRSGVVPSLVDLFFVPADAEFAMSSTYRRSGVAVTITFQKLTSSRFEREEAIFRELSIECGRLGGRVHLVKQVFADPAQIEQMYGDGIALMRRVRSQTGATAALVNGFAGRVLPGLCTAR